MDARQMAPRVVDTAEVSVMIESNVGSVESAAEAKMIEVAVVGAPVVVDLPSSIQFVDPAPISPGVSQSQPQDVQVTLDTGMPATSDETAHPSALLCDAGSSKRIYLRALGKPQQPEVNEQGPRPTESRGVMGALISELKTRLAMGKKSTAGRPVGTPSPTKGAFVIISRSDCRRSDKENMAMTSELQQAFARRRSGGSFISGSCRNGAEPSPQPQDRRPLAPVRGVGNVQRTLGTPSPQTSPDRLPSPININTNLPGADCTTELVTTAFGTRKVRRMVIPPVLEGSLPSRDPRIIMELNCLRAQQKVGGGSTVVGGGITVSRGLET
ncbi:hypothetical protein B0H17DRAFT_1094347 [Mycena rosella]|uniref:Uncharacterized protein n=1 Tax=Mycena rosella TaxID=1033263 RepID=A0AAD7G357_MYCRO|nr:hypothetical protein B0H17DRAFT_1094347 [Mycena rosella]